jgi:hydroxyacylglutathione hydrolase
MILRQFLYEATSCASYLFGCTSKNKLGVVDPHVDLVDAYIAGAVQIGVPIAAVFETHVQADHVSGLPDLVAQTGATPYLPAGANVAFDHVPLSDGAVVELGNTRVRALSTPGHAPAHHAYVISDHRRKTDDPWLVFTGDSLLINDVGRPDLHVSGDVRAQAELLFGSLARLLDLADGVVVLPSHYGGSVCGRGLSGNPLSSIGFERAHNPMLEFGAAGPFADALLADMPKPPEDQARIVAENRRGAPRARA